MSKEKLKKILFSLIVSKLVIKQLSYAKINYLPEFISEVYS